jgi:S-methylmethionine-dependent homocysteine/selenocysteine methylase
VNGKVLLLDGATGTELNRRGVDTGLPLWSANALTTEAGLNVLRQIHLDYLKAGADIITTNTFRMHRRVLAGNGHDARVLTRRAVAAAQAAVAEFGQPARVAGSVAPLEDCYRHDLVPPDDECRAEHSERIQHLVEAGVDLLLIETMTSIREAVIAAEFATIAGRPTWVSFVCDREGRILSGESVAMAAERLLPLGVNALGVNCGPAHTLAKPLAELRAVCGPDFPLLAYGNIGHADEKDGWINTDAVAPENYLQYARRWPVQIVGGCCGSTPSSQPVRNTTGNSSPLLACSVSSARRSARGSCRLFSVSSASSASKAARSAPQRRGWRCHVAGAGSCPPLPAEASRKSGGRWIGPTAAPAAARSGRASPAA